MTRDIGLAAQKAQFFRDCLVWVESRAASQEAKDWTVWAKARISALEGRKHD
jgi:hypothetical protein